MDTSAAWRQESGRIARRRSLAAPIRARAVRRRRREVCVVLNNTSVFGFCSFLKSVRRVESAAGWGGI